MLYTIFGTASVIIFTLIIVQIVRDFRTNNL